MQTYLSSDGRSWPVSDRWPINDPNATIRANARATLERIIGHLGDRPLASVFGPDTTLDQVHGGSWSPDTCGCVLHTIHDHYAPEKGSIAHRSHVTCEHHAHLTTPVAHHAAVLAECQHKERVRATLAAHLGVPHSEIGWTFDGQRELLVSHPTLHDGDAAIPRAQAIVSSEHPDRPAHVVGAIAVG